MRSRRLVFVFFAGAILFSMLREWQAPMGCSVPLHAQQAAVR
jgi:hypothetical protein